MTLLNLLTVQWLIIRMKVAGRGHCTVNKIELVHKSFVTTLSYSLYEKLWVLLLIWICCFQFNIV